MWRDVCVANRAALLDELDAYTAVLARLRTAIQKLATARRSKPYSRARAWRAPSGRNNARAAPRKATHRNSRVEITGNWTQSWNSSISTIFSCVRHGSSAWLEAVSNRVLLLAALAEGETTITNLLDSDDTRVMLDALEKLRRASGARRRHDAS